MNDGCLGVRIAGPLRPFAEGFRLWLNGRWYAETTATEQLRLMGHLSRWLVAEGLDCAGLSDGVVGDFLRARRATGYQNLVSPRGLAPQLEYLRSVGAVPEPSTPVAATTTARLLQRYRQYLLEERRLVTGTVDNYVAVSRRFLQYCGHGTCRSYQL